MRLLKYLYLLFGVGLLGYIVYQTDMSDVSGMLVQVGWGMAVVVGLYFLAFLLDSISWMYTVSTIKPSWLWSYRFWKVRMIGEAYNNTIPAAGMGGEPVKSVLLKKHYDIGYREGVASLILAKTINMIALIIFLAISFIYMMQSEAFSGSVKFIAGAGFAILTVATLLFFLVQRLSLTSLTGSWLHKTRFASRLETVLHHIHDMDERLIDFYTRFRGRLALALFLAFANWMLGVAEIYYAMIFLGHPVSWGDAWIIEGVTQLIRSGTFFIPLSIGAQEGAFVMVCTAITGLPTLGLAVGIVRRIREVIWIGWGFVLSWVYTRKSH